MQPTNDRPSSLLSLNRFFIEISTSNHWHLTHSIGLHPLPPYPVDPRCGIAQLPRHLQLSPRLWPVHVSFLPASSPLPRSPFQPPHTTIFTHHTAYHTAHHAALAILSALSPGSNVLMKVGGCILLLFCVCATTACVSLHHVCAIILCVTYMPVTHVSVGCCNIAPCGLRANANKRTHVCTSHVVARDARSYGKPGDAVRVLQTPEARTLGTQAYARENTFHSRSDFLPLIPMVFHIFLFGPPQPPTPLPQPQFS